MMAFFRAAFTALTVACGLFLANIWHTSGWPVGMGSWISCFAVHYLFLFLFMMTIKVYVEDD
jgi:hypothetical protein